MRQAPKHNNRMNTKTNSKMQVDFYSVKIKHRLLQIYFLNHFHLRYYHSFILFGLLFYFASTCEYFNMRSSAIVTISVDPIKSGVR